MEVNLKILDEKLPVQSASKSRTATEEVKRQINVEDALKRTRDERAKIQAFNSELFRVLTEVASKITEKINQGEYSCVYAFDFGTSQPMIEAVEKALTVLGYLAALKVGELYVMNISWKA